MSTSAEIAKEEGDLIVNGWEKRLLKKWAGVIKSLPKNPSITWKRKLPAIHCYFVNNEGFNAFACRASDGYAIVIYSGLLNTLLRFYSSLLADPRALTGIGVAASETEADASRMKTWKSVSKKLMAGNIRVPTDKNRLNFVGYMTDLTLRFAFEHELSHVLLGHADLLESGQPLFEVQDSDPLKQRRSKAMEMQADEMAFRRSFLWIGDSLQGCATQDPMLNLYGTNDGPILDYFCATYCLFQLFDAEIKYETHPNPIHRQIRLMDKLPYLAKQIKLKLQHKPTEIVKGVRKNVDLYMEDALGIDWSSRRRRSRLILSSRSQMNKTIGGYASDIQALFPELEPLAYVALT